MILDMLHFFWEFGIAGTFAMQFLRPVVQGWLREAVWNGVFLACGVWLEEGMPRRVRKISRTATSPGISRTLMKSSILQGYLPVSVARWETEVSTPRVPLMSVCEYTLFSRMSEKPIIN